MRNIRLLRKIIISLSMITLVAVVGCSTKANTTDNQPQLATIDLGKANIQVPQEWKNNYGSEVKEPPKILYGYSVFGTGVDLSVFAKEIDSSESDPVANLESMIESQFKGEETVNITKSTRVINGISCEIMDFEGAKYSSTGNKTYTVRTVQVYYPELNYLLTCSCSPLREPELAVHLGVDLNEIQARYENTVNEFYEIIDSIQMN